MRQDNQRNAIEKEDAVEGDAADEVEYKEMQGFDHNEYRYVDAEHGQTCGSMSRGQRRALLTMMALSMEKLSLGKP